MKRKRWSHEETSTLARMDLQAGGSAAYSVVSQYLPGRSEDAVRANRRQKQYV